MSRGNNEGSIYQTASGEWRGAISLPAETLPDGTVKRPRKFFRGATREDVSNQLKKALRDQQTGTLVIDERSTVAEYLSQWIEAQAPQLRPSTLASYRDIIRRHLGGSIGKRPLARLSVLEVQSHLNQKHAAGLSPRSVTYIRAVLRAALNDAMKFGFVFRNVAALADPPKAERFEIQPLTIEQAKRFIQRAGEHRLGAMFTVCLAIGLRKGEALGLRWKDVDLDTATLRVVQTIQRIKGKGLVTAPPKSDKGRRMVKLPAVAVRALARHKAVQEQEREWAGSEWADSGLVFTNRKGTAFDPRNIQDEFRAILKPTKEEIAAKVEPLPAIRFHDLRHSAATLLLAQGVPARVVMDLLGHSQISLTLGTYSHVLPAMLDDAASKMDAALSPVSDTNPNRVAAGIAASSTPERVN